MLTGCGSSLPEQDQAVVDAAEEADLSGPPEDVLALAHRFCDGFDTPGMTAEVPIESLRESGVSTDGAEHFLAVTVEQLCPQHQDELG